MPSRLTTEAATQAWEDLAERLDRFIEAWTKQAEPSLVEFVPAEPASHRRLVLIELIKVDLEQRTTRGQTKTLEQYVIEHPELLENGEPPCDLIYEEFHIRRGAGLNVALSEYCSRFPKSAEALKRLLGTEGVSVSTLIRPAARRLDGVVPGQRLDDFDLLVEIGKGAFASVFLARQVSMQRLVALKVSADKGNEPQTLATLDHPNIVRVFDQRRLPEQRVRLLYMQFAPGGTIADVVRRVRETPLAARSGSLLIGAVNDALAKTGNLSGDDSPWKRRVAAATWPEIVCRIGVQLAQALDHAHKQGILHRDVKPANILLSADGSPKLADFNISFSSQIEGASPAAYFGGSLAYMSPEQLEACNPKHPRQPGELDGRSDLYALAVVLWELLHGQRPFDDDDLDAGWTGTLEAMTFRRRGQLPKAPPGARDPISSRLQQVLQKALSSDPSQRQPDGGALARELSLCLNPRAWDLVNDLSSGWRNLARTRPYLALIPMNLPPFVLASMFNYYYNEEAFIRHQPRAIQEAFWIMFYPINGLLFPLGIALVLWYAWPVVRALRCLATDGNCSPEQLRFARGRSLVLGHWIAGMGLALWMIAGIAFPVGIHMQVESFPVAGYVHFMLSMFICGLISCCFPFLITTWLTLRVFFPALLASSSPDSGEQRRLAALSKHAGWFLAMAAVVPLLGMLLATWSGSDTREYTVILIIGSVIGFIAAYATYNRIRTDLAALTIATRTTDLLGTDTESAATF